MKQGENDKMHYTGLFFILHSSAFLLNNRTTHRAHPWAYLNQYNNKPAKTLTASSENTR